MRTNATERSARIKSTEYSRAGLLLRRFQYEAEPTMTRKPV
jgi:hypothetical protein